jgi:hypothetical protein
VKTRFHAPVRIGLLGLALWPGCAGSHGGGEAAADDASVAPGSDGAILSPDARASVDARGSTDVPHASCLPRVPERHRAEPVTCDHQRPPGTPPPDGGPSAQCTTDAECTDGENGRCSGNNHDGWSCTYDACFIDADCGASSVCECGGGFRSDANVCLAGGCATDADCETGFCSPTQGSCGAYLGTIGWYCHTCEDECVTDGDCGPIGGDPFDPYCMFDPELGHWRCSESHCAG